MSTFCCGGGSSMGYKLAGCEVIAGNDIDPQMAWHYKTNLQPKHFFLCPIAELLEAALPDELFQLDILDGSPPCSTFSMAGSREDAWGKKKHFREGQAEQVLSDLFFDFIAFAGRIQPRTIIAENVKGMILGNAKGYTKQVMQRFHDIGYVPQLFLLNAADCGVPQKRERVFFVARRRDEKKPALALTPSKSCMTVRQALSGLPQPTKKELEDAEPSPKVRLLWQHSQQGESLQDANRRLTGKLGWFTWRRLHPDRPSPTIVSGADSILHWSEQRHMTFREECRLGSFPDDYIAESDAIGKYMVGMSVPPRMAEYVAREVCTQWLGVKYASS